MGKLIIIEGMDGSGTTTQTKMLANYLMGLGYKVLSTAEPTNSSIGQEIRKWLKEPLEKEPDLTLLLDTPAHIAYERIASRQGPKDFYETVPMLNRLRERYVHFVQLEAKNTALIDGSASPNEVHNHVVSVISNKLERAL